MQVSVQQKAIKWLWLAVFVTVFGIFLRLSFYNCPQSDDFLYGMWMREWGFADSNITIYYAWGGRYFSNLILTLCNGLSYSNDYREFLVPYQLHSVVHILLFILSTLILVKRIPFLPGLWTGMIPLIFFINDAPSVSEFFFWLAGTATYCSGYIFGAIAIAAAIDFNRLVAGNIQIWPEKKDVWWTAGLAAGIGICTMMAGIKNVIFVLNSLPLLILSVFCLLVALIIFLMFRASAKNIRASIFCLMFSSFAAAGSNELAGAILVISFSMIWLRFFSKRMVLNPLFYLPLIISLSALALNVLAPATANREVTVNRELIFNWTNASYGAAAIFSRLLRTIPLFVTGILVAGVFPIQRPAEKTELRRHFLFFLLFQLITNGFLPLAILLKAGELPSRAINLHQLTMYLSVFLLAIHIGHFIPNSIFSRTNALLIPCLFSPLLLGISIGPENLNEAILDLSSGRASAFFHEFCKEQDDIQACSLPVCEVNPLASKPFCISSSSNAVIRDSDPPSWIGYKNSSYAAFFGKKEIFRRIE